MFRSLKAYAGALAVFVVLSLTVLGLASAGAGAPITPAGEMSLASEAMSLTSEAVSSPDDTYLQSDALDAEGDAEPLFARGFCSYSCQPCISSCPVFDGLPQTCQRLCF